MEHITMHHCIQGWSGIAKWGELPMKKLVELVWLHTEAHTKAFYSFGEALYGGPYYDTQRLENVLKDRYLLASQMNGKRLERLYGAPLHLRVENHARLQNGEMDRENRICRIGGTAGKGRGRKE